jgi:hypothetical protein
LKAVIKPPLLSYEEDVGSVQTWSSSWQFGTTCCILSVTAIAGFASNQPGFDYAEEAQAMDIRTSLTFRRDFFLMCPVCACRSI